MAAFSTLKVNKLIHPEDEDEPEWYDDSTSSYNSSPLSSRTPSRASSSSSSSNEPSSPTETINPPNIISISNLEPLRLAKKKHYISSQTASKIQKKTGAPKPQGRPFNDTLNARFLCFNSIDDLIANLLNINDQDTVRLLKEFPIIPSLTGFNNSSIKLSAQRKLIEGIINASKELNLKSIEQTVFQLKSIEFEKINETSLNIYEELCDEFELKEFSFVKIIRNNKGRLVKFEILSNIPNDEIDINFIKKFITYPRYKSKMKIFMINCKFEEDVWFYNDLRMLFWDIENHQVCHKKILLNNKILKLTRI